MTSRSSTILVVSPHRATQRRVSKFLEVFGYDVRQATDAETALAAAAAACPDFLILDGTSGEPADLQVVRALRRACSGNYVYSFFLSDRLDSGDVASALEAGFDDFLAAPLVFGELLARLRAGARVIEFERRLAAQAGIDSNTGLPDQESLAAEIRRRAERTQGAIGWLAVIDLDFFQRIVLELGRGGAREALLEAARRLIQQLSPECFTASLGEDRFAVLMPPAGVEPAARVCERVLTSLSAESIAVGQREYRLTASCGLRQVAAGETLEVALAGAERALRLAKSSGRNCVVNADEVDRDADEWAALAADGNLFASTLARDVMHACPLLLSLDESLEQAHAMLAQAGLAHAPVIDPEHKLAGLVSLDQLAAARLKTPKARSSTGAGSSVRLVRHVMTTDVVRFDECTPLAELMEFFTAEAATLAVVVQGKKPRGLIHCQALAALNEPLTAGHFVSSKPRSGTSADLLVPDLAMAE